MMRKKYTERDPDRCNNCGAYLGEGEKYCTKCGTKRGEGEYNPRDYYASVLYGPPYSAVYECGRCGHKFAVHGLGGAQKVRYCPECGGESKLIKY